MESYRELIRKILVEFAVNNCTADAAYEAINKIMVIVDGEKTAKEHFRRQNVSMLLELNSIIDKNKEMP